MTIFLQIFSFLFAILLLVSVHEFGHMWVARKVGVKVLRFSIGFGKPIFLWHGKDGTEYVIAWIPLGGYVRLLDEREMEVPAAEKHMAFNRKPLFSRFLVLLAGPLTNWLLAILLYWLVFMIGFEQVKPIVGKVIPASIAAQAGLQPGEQIIAVDNHKTLDWQKILLAVVNRMGETSSMQMQTVLPNGQQTKNYSLNIQHWTVNGLNPDPLEGLGIVPYQPAIPAVIAVIQKNSPADKAGLQVGDKILTLHGQPIKDWMDLMKYIQNHPGDVMQLLILRQGKEQLITAQIEAKRATNFKRYGFLGVGASPVDFPANMKVKQNYSIFSAWVPAVAETYSFSIFNFVMFGKMLVGHISLQGLGGPITIFTSAKDAFKQGVLIYISFLALLSTMLACINILPIPGLDGGHILFLGIEAIRGRAVPVATQLFVWRIGLIFLVAVMLQATINDLMRFF